MTFRARNDLEKEKLKQFRRICRKDDYEYTDLFMPVIDRVIASDNPQLHFVKTSEALILSKNLLPAPKVEIKITCGRCGGEGCQFCAQLGFYYEESAP